MQSLRAIKNHLIKSRFWEKGHLSLLQDHKRDITQIKESNHTDSGHLMAAAEWLERAQDSTKSGGISGRYKLYKGWSSAYPETTGYIIPTFLRLANELELTKFIERAERAANFLFTVQLPDGSFPGNEVDENKNVPSMFDTAQIMHGLLAWYKYSGNEIALDSSLKAADWLVSIQDKDGAWRKAVYLDQVYTYSAHASCWLAEVGNYTGSKNYLQAAEKHLKWVLQKVDKTTYWFDLSGFTKDNHQNREAVTHTIAYTMWGVLFSSRILSNIDGINAVERASAKIVNSLNNYNYLPGMLDSNWKAKSKYSCLTGNAQMALIFFELYKMGFGSQYKRAAFKLIEDVKKVQSLDNANPGLRGGIPGSYPIWGDYIYMSIPNWAAKFFIDSILEKYLVMKESKTEIGAK